MPEIRYYLRRDSDGTSLGGGTEVGPNVSLAAVQARMPVGVTVLDATANPEPPTPAQPDFIGAAQAIWDAAAAGEKTGVMRALWRRFGRTP